MLAVEDRELTEVTDSLCGWDAVKDSGDGRIGACGAGGGLAGEVLDGACDLKELLGDLFEDDEALFVGSSGGNMLPAKAAPERHVAHKGLHPFS